MYEKQTIAKGRQDEYVKPREFMEGDLVFVLILNAREKLIPNAVEKKVRICFNICECRIDS